MRTRTTTSKVAFLGIVLCMILTSFPPAVAEETCILPPSDMIAWWPGDRNTADMVGRRKGLLIGSANFGPGVVADGFNFDRNGWIEVADDPIWTLGTKDFTIDLWVRFNSLSGRDPLIAHNNGSGEQDKWVFLYDELGHDKQLGVPALRFHINSPHPEPVPFPHDTVAAPWNPLLGRWYHVAVTRRGINYALYIDGTQVAADVSTFIIPDPSAPLTIGTAEADSSIMNLDGSVDEVEIFNRALSASEIQAIFNAGSMRKCLPREGDLDTSFSGDGKLLTGIADRTFDQATAIAVQPDGKLVVAGSSGTNVAVFRFLSNGTLDNSFSSNGKLHTNISNVDLGNALALQPDGKIVVAGISSNDFLAVRFLSNGKLDDTFNGKGWVTTDFGAFDDALAISLQQDGKIVVAGVTNRVHANFALARYLPNGKLDQTFSGGTVITDFGTDALIEDLALQPDGKIVVVGQLGGDFVVARYLSNGLLDGSFNGNGFVTTNFGGIDRATTVALQPDGKIVAAGFTGSNFAGLARFLPNGLADPAFGDSGKVLIDFGAGGGNRADGVALQPDGKIVVAGTASTNPSASDFALARYLPNGILDARFGNDGKVITNFGGNLERALALAIQPRDGRLVVAGVSNAIRFGSSSFAVARYHAITCNGVVVTRVGTAGNDNIVGTSGDDVIFAFGGNDVVDGLGGNDILCGGTGNDTLRGGGGDDIIRGGPGNDICRGGTHVRGDRAVDCESIATVP